MKLVKTSKKGSWTLVALEFFSNSPLPSSLWSGIILVSSLVFIEFEIRWSLLAGLLQSHLVSLPSCPCVCLVCLSSLSFKSVILFWQWWIGGSSWFSIELKQCNGEASKVQGRYNYRAKTESRATSRNSFQSLLLYFWTFVVVHCRKTTKLRCCAHNSL